MLRGGTWDLLTAHVGDEKSTIWLGSNLICDRGEESTVGLLESWAVRICRVKVVGGILGYC